MRLKERRICFVTGTRAEFGLMQSVLRAIQSHPRLQLQLVVTGMHLSSAHGRSIRQIRNEGWRIDATVPWPGSAQSPAATAHATGEAMSRMAQIFERLKSEIILVTGDRVEPFAAVSAGHISQRIVAHIHGGDRAPGQIDDSLRHAISKLAHVHFPATRASADRLKRLGEDVWRIHPVGSPGIDGIVQLAASESQLNTSFPSLERHRFALLLLHPVESNAAVEQKRAFDVLKAVIAAGIRRIVAIYPNNDPGSAGIIRCWNEHRSAITHLVKDIPRPMFLGLLRDAAMLVGNSSSGIIEAASFGTPVVDIGPRQQGRDRSENVTNVPYGKAAIGKAVARVWNDGRPLRWRGRNCYGGAGTGGKIADILASIAVDDRLRRKLIAY